MREFLEELADLLEVHDAQIGIGCDSMTWAIIGDNSINEIDRYDDWTPESIREELNR